MEYALGWKAVKEYQLNESNGTAVIIQGPQGKQNIIIKIDDKIKVYHGNSSDMKKTLASFIQEYSLDTQKEISDLSLKLKQAKGTLEAISAFNNTLELNSEEDK